MVSGPGGAGRGGGGRSNLSGAGVPYNDMNQL